MKVKTRILFLILIPVLAGLIIFGYQSLVYVPSWYYPVFVEPEDQQKLRDDFTVISAKINSAMQKPDEFDISLSANDINRFISGIAYLDPRLKDMIPPEIMDPVVQMEDNYLKVGALLDHKGKKVFASLSLKVIPQGDTLIIDDLRAKIGFYTIPTAVLKKHADRVLKKFTDHGIDEILNAKQCQNLFSYPNGDYDFRIKSLIARNGSLLATIEPVERIKRKAWR